MTRPLFEQYKEALRKGHLAARAGKIDAALAAYGEAARLAPDRAAPHTSRATALHRAGRSAEAQAWFERALAIAPDDEATLRARAVVFEEIGRSASAAADLERLAEALERAGRRADALALARRAVVLTATPARRRLVARLEAPGTDRPASAPAQQAPPVMPGAPKPQVPLQTAKASRTRETPIPPAARPSIKRDAPAREAPTREAPTREAPPRTSRRPRLAAPRPAAKPEAAAEPLAVERKAAPEAVIPPAEAPVIERGPEPPAPQQAGPTAKSRAETPAESPAEPPTEASIPWPAVDLPSPPPPMPVGPPPNVDALMAEATAFIDVGDLAAARNVMLTAVAVHRAAGRPDAALDVCLQLLALAPGDAYVHLAIAGLQLDRGWQTLATEKIALLLRLTALTGDTQAEADVHGLASERLRDEPVSAAGAR